MDKMLDFEAGDKVILQYRELSGVTITPGGNTLIEFDGNSIVLNNVGASTLTKTLVLGDVVIEIA
jgi:hypothetical protein